MSLSYETARKLKEAGFPFDFGNNTIFDSMPPGYSFDRHPRLDDLIEECGQGFDRLEFDKDYIDKNKDKWECEGMVILENKNGYIHESSLSFFGPIPEEAVANLWLALNKK